MSRDELWGRVRQCAQTNPVVSHCVARYLDGDCTLEEALMEAVLALVNVNAGYQRMVRNLLAEMSPGVA